MLADVAPYLRCPHCAAGLSLADRVLGCASGHRFDVARQGYVSLLPGDARSGTADTARMVRARAEFLASGEFGPLTDAVVRAVADAVGAEPETVPGCVVDAGGGTGHHLAAVLDGFAHRVGICCDLSRYAARRAAFAICTTIETFAAIAWTARARACDVPLPLLQIRHLCSQLVRS